MGTRRTLRGVDRSQACARLALVLLLGLAAGCAVAAEENRRTLNAMDRSLTPGSEAERWALAPVALPAGLVGLVADALVVHPTTTLDAAWGDTVEMLWTPAEDESRLRRAVFTPFSALLTPFVFVGDAVWRSMFVITPRDGDVERSAPPNPSEWLER